METCGASRRKWRGGAACAVFVLTGQSLGMISSLLDLAEWHGLWSMFWRFWKFGKGFLEYLLVWKGWDSGSEICGNDGFPGLGWAYV